MQHAASYMVKILEHNKHRYGHNPVKLRIWNHRSARKRMRAYYQYRKGTLLATLGILWPLRRYQIRKV